MIHACASANTFWYVGATFSDNATVTGTFTINAAFNALVTWNVAVSGSTHPTADYDYANGVSNFFGVTPTSVDFGSIPFASYLNLALSSAMTNGGGTINLASGSLDCPAIGGCGTLVSGRLSTQPLPEPGTLGLMGAALAGIGLLARKRAART
jgi:hypothetical protein